MYAILGAAGKVGYATASTLRASGMPVRAVLRDASKGAALVALGCEIVVADMQDPKALAAAIAGADAAQVVVPLSPKAADPVADMQRSLSGVVTALRQAGPHAVLAISDYGAHVDQDIGMPSLFNDFEKQLAGICRHTVILRSAEHMQNWGRVISGAIDSGRLPTFLDPLSRQVPMISAPDLGKIAATLLLRTNQPEGHEVLHAEGPERYGASDVAMALSALSGRTVRAEAVPRAQWGEIMKRGMPESLADLLIKTNDAVNQGGVVDVEAPPGAVCHGTTRLIDALRPLLPTH